MQAFYTPDSIVRCLSHLDAINCQRGGTYFNVKMRMKDGQDREELLGKFDGESLFPLDVSKLGLECPEEPYGIPFPIELIDFIYGVDLNGNELLIKDLVRECYR